MSWRSIIRLAVISGASLALTGCETGGTSANDPAGNAAPAFFGKPKVVESDVESPDVFSFAGKGLWDGRPSLGGIWVAHSSVTDPERAIIRNSSNGKSVVGALFRRERENPGPSLQVSSDAAEAVGLIAGQPTEMTVVALRRVEVPVADDPQLQISAEAPATTTAETAVPSVQDGAAPVVAAASSAPPPNPQRVATAVASGVDTAAAGAEMGKKPAKKGLFGFLSKKPKPEKAAPEAAPLTALPATGEIEQKPLDPVVAAAAQGISQAEAGQSAGAEPTAVAAESTADPAMRRAFVQIGIFSSEENAQFAVDQMKAEGMIATVKTGGSATKPFWRVLVGPLTSVAERDTLIGRIKKVGYKDAYPVRQ